MSPGRSLIILQLFTFLSFNYNCTSELSKAHGRIKFRKQQAALDTVWRGFQHACIFDGENYCSISIYSFARIHQVRSYKRRGLSDCVSYGQQYYTGVAPRRKRCTNRGANARGRPFLFRLSFLTARIFYSIAIRPQTYRLLCYTRVLYTYCFWRTNSVIIVCVCGAQSRPTRYDDNNAHNVVLAHHYWASRCFARCAARTRPRAGHTTCLLHFSVHRALHKSRCHACVE